MCQPRRQALTRQAGAKSLSISIPGKTAPKASDSIPQAGEQPPRASLVTLSKREHARRRLMSGFVRGEVLGPTHRPDEGPADDGSPPMTPAQSKAARREAKAARRQAKAERRAAKAQRRERKAAKAARREARAARDGKRAERAALDAEREARREAKSARKQAKAERRAAKTHGERGQEHAEPAQAAPRKRRSSTAEEPPNKKRA